MRATDGDGSALKIFSSSWSCSGVVLFLGLLIRKLGGVQWLSGVNRKVVVNLDLLMPLDEERVPIRVIVALGLKE